MFLFYCRWQTGWHGELVPMFDDRMNHVGDTAPNRLAAMKYVLGKVKRNMQEGGTEQNERSHV